MRGKIASSAREEDVVLAGGIVTVAAEKERGHYVGSDSDGIRMDSWRRLQGQGHRVGGEA